MILLRFRPNDIVSVGQRTLLYRDIFTVMLATWSFCNYRCSYCWPYARSDKKDSRPTSCVPPPQLLMNPKTSKGKRIPSASLFGGESHSISRYLVAPTSADDVANTNYTHTYDFPTVAERIGLKLMLNMLKIRRASITASLHLQHVNSKEKIAGLC